MTDLQALPVELADLCGSEPREVEAVSFDLVDAKFRPVRFGEREDRVDLFARILAADPTGLPPVILVESNDGYLIADGWHRALATVGLELNEIRAIVLPSLTPMDAAQTARLIGARMTARASQPLTKAERKELALALAQDHPDWSDRQVAGESGLDHKTVGKLRRQGTDDATTAASDSDPSWPSVDDAVRQLDRFLVKLREAAVFDNVTKFRKGTARRLAHGLQKRYGDEAPNVAATIARYFTETAEALDDEA